jgi:hypothetical protein
MVGVAAGPSENGLPVPPLKEMLRFSRGAVLRDGDAREKPLPAVGLLMPAVDGLIMPVLDGLDAERGGEERGSPTEVIEP